MTRITMTMADSLEGHKEEYHPLMACLLVAAKTIF